MRNVQVKWRGRNLVTEEWGVKLEVNGRSITLNTFVRQMIASLILGMIAPLKNLPENPETITVRVWKLKK